MPSRTRQAKSENSDPSTPPEPHTGQQPGTPGYGSVVDRRSGLDRREIAAALERARRLNAAEEPGDQDSPPTQTNTPPTGLERRRGPGRRLSDFTRSAEEGELTSEQFLFVMAIEAFKRSNDRMFPTWCDVLEVVRLLGYRKTMPSELNLRNAEDWRESPLTPSNVRAPRWNENGKVDAERAKSSTSGQHRRESDRRAA
ncbi:MAG: hypothetical protein KF838_09885 [Phycisphaeraceae bacterium]|nr:MAG: hypothetical protein KF838_09885 [Phycisphaeraceae bacterium]